MVGVLERIVPLLIVSLNIESESGSEMFGTLLLENRKIDLWGRPGTSIRFLAVVIVFFSDI